MTGMELVLQEPVTVEVWMDSGLVEVTVDAGPLPDGLPEPVRRHLIEAYGTPAPDPDPDPTPRARRTAKEA